jgi:hypothetical protein
MNNFDNFKYVTGSYNENLEEKLKELLLYKKIISVEKIDMQNGILTLDDGIQLAVLGNRGCGGCENGWYYIDELNCSDNVITNVECTVEGDEEVFNIFVYSEDIKINCVQYSGQDNGYYGTGYRLYIKIPQEGENA